ncbi:Uncharacterised protein r2_g3830 [Pycnogonum litorale]
MTGGKLEKRKLKKVNCASLPPCIKVLQKHIQRAAYVASMWANAHEADPSMGMSPYENGWTKDKEGINVPEWFDGEIEPAHHLSSSQPSLQLTTVSRLRCRNVTGTAFPEIRKRLTL